MTDQFTYDELLKLARSGMFVAGAPVINADGEKRIFWFIAAVDAKAFATGHSPHKPVRAAQGLGVLSHWREHAPHRGLTLV